VHRIAPFEVHHEGYEAWFLKASPGRVSALMSAWAADGFGMPGLDAVILGSLLVPECTEIYPTESHLELYQKKGFKIVNLHL